MGEKKISSQKKWIKTDLKGKTDLIRIFESNHIFTSRAAAESYVSVGGGGGDDVLLFCTF